MPFYPSPLFRKDIVNHLNFDNVPLKVDRVPLGRVAVGKQVLPVFKSCLCNIICVGYLHQVMIKNNEHKALVHAEMS